MKNASYLAPWLFPIIIQQKMASVATAEIESVRNTQAGTSHGPVPGTFGLASVPVAGIEWEPRGPSVDVGPFAGSINNGIGPTEQTVTSLDSWEHISYPYMAPDDIGDGSDLQIMSRMLVFTVRKHNVDDESTIVIPLMKANKLFQDAWNDFVEKTTAPPNPKYDQEAVDFLDWMQTFGERGLEAYAWARFHERKNMYEKWDKTAPALKLFWQRSTQQGYCYLTRYGIMQTLNFAGVVINTNRAETLLGLDDTLTREHYLQINVGYAKRIECAQQFGSNDDIVTGARLWITLTRKACPQGQYGAFVLRPGGSKLTDGPLNKDRCYADESGAICRGHVWRVGVVITPPTQLPSVIAQDRANNTGDAPDERLAYLMHASLPSMYVAVGYKH